MDKGGTQANTSKDKKVDDTARGITHERWQRECVSRKEGGRTSSRVEDNIDVSIQRLEDSIKKSKEI